MIRCRWISVLLAFAVLAAPAYAQDGATVVRSIEISVRPGMNGQLDEFLRALRGAAEEQGFDGLWRTAQSLSGSPVYMVTSPFASWGDLLNAGPRLVDAYGEEETARLVGLFGSAVESVHTVYHNQFASMSYPPVNLDSPPEAVMVLDFNLNPGGAQRFRELTEKVAEATRAVTPGAYFVSMMPGVGASGPRTILIMPSLAGQDNPPPGPVPRLIQHFGQEEGSRIVSMNDSVASFTTTLYRTRPDLSYTPAD